jgi:hypothetical protein
MAQNKTPEEQRAVIAKLAKLLRLSRGTDHAAEAASALAKAAELAAEAGLALDGIDADSDTPRITHEAGGAKRCSHSRQRCHSILRRHFGVDVLGSSHQGAIYVGPALNIALARHIETYLVRQCAAGWTAFHAPKKRRRKTDMRRAYEFGFYGGIDKVLAAHPIRNDSPVLAAAIEKYVGETFAVVTTKYRAPSMRYRETIMNGFMDGRATPCSRPVAGAAPAMTIGGAA